MVNEINIPDGMGKDVFSSQLAGVFGSFSTSQSYCLNYILTTLRVNELKMLDTATDILDFREISFEELLQRDIDYRRINEELISDYLERGSNRVIFFPPLLVSLMAFDVNTNKMIDRYSSIHEEQKDSKFIRTWDGDKFQLILNLSKSSTGYKFTHKNTVLNYYNYAASIKFNPELVKLVVIDGQHRFVALRELIMQGKADLLNDMEVPICVFFPPRAVNEAGNLESIVKDIRELFVTVNEKAKQVSGHFLTLLDDKQLSSFCVRSLADKWKNENGVATKLHLLEWNERESRRASQRQQKEYSVTTVSVIADCLSGYILDSKRGGLTEILLNLQEVQAELSKIQTVFSTIKSMINHFPWVNLIF